MWLGGSSHVVPNPARHIPPLVQRWKSQTQKAIPLGFRWRTTWDSVCESALSLRRYANTRVVSIMCDHWRSVRTHDKIKLNSVEINGWNNKHWNEFQNMDTIFIWGKWVSVYIQIKDLSNGALFKCLQNLPSRALCDLFCFCFASALASASSTLARVHAGLDDSFISFDVRLHPKCHLNILPHIFFFLALFGCYYSCYLLNKFRYDSPSALSGLSSFQTFFCSFVYRFTL